MPIKLKGTDRATEFALIHGMVMGFLSAPDIIDYCESRGVSREDVKKAFDALVKVADVHYFEQIQEFKKTQARLNENSSST